jgi:hypothetical protein
MNSRVYYSWTLHRLTQVVVDPRRVRLGQTPRPRLIAVSSRRLVRGGPTREVHP